MGKSVPAPAVPASKSKSQCGGLLVWGGDSSHTPAQPLFNCRANEKGQKKHFIRHVAAEALNGEPANAHSPGQSRCRAMGLGSFASRFCGHQMATVPAVSPAAPQLSHAMEPDFLFPWKAVGGEAGPGCIRWPPRGVAKARVHQQLLWARAVLPRTALECRSSAPEQQ